MLISLNKFLKSKFKNKYEKAVKQRYKLVSRYCNNINIEYLKEMCNDNNNKIYLYSINDILTENYKNEIIGIAVIRKILNTTSKIRLYIPLITIHTNMRNFGYGKLIIDEIANKYNKNKTLEIVLLSLKSTYDFYNKLGFVEKKIKYIEKNESIGECIMMVNNYNKI